MTNDDFWADARLVTGRSWLDRGRANTARFNAAHAPAPPEVTTAEPTDYLMGMSMDDYAQQRSSMPVANDFGLVEENMSGFADAKDLMVSSATELAAATNPYRIHPNTGYEVRQRGIPASQVESIGGITGRGNVNPNT
jgi:hypothetical protein